MTTAATIDAALRLGKSPHQIAIFHGIELSKVISRAEMLARRKAEVAAKIAEKAKNAPRPDLEQIKRERNSLAKWAELPITYEDHPSSRPFDYSRAFSNTVALARNPEADRTLGGVVRYEGREAA